VAKLEEVATSREEVKNRVGGRAGGKVQMGWRRAEERGDGWVADRVATFTWGGDEQR
jgi:hypothetical protein